MVSFSAQADFFLAIIVHIARKRLSLLVLIPWRNKKKRRNQQQQNRKNRHSSFVFLLCYFEMFTSVSFVFYFHIKRRKYFTLARARPWQCAYVAYSCAACVCVLCVQHSKRDSSNHFRNEATELSRMH